MKMLLNLAPSVIVQALLLVHHLAYCQSQSIPPIAEWPLSGYTGSGSLQDVATGLCWAVNISSSSSIPGSALNLETCNANSWNQFFSFTEPYNYEFALVSISPSSSKLCVEFKTSTSNLIVRVISIFIYN